MGLRDKIIPTLTTPLIRANMSSVVGSYHLLRSCFSLIVISMANLYRLVAASFSSLALLSSSVSKANLSCMLATTFSSLRNLSNSFSSPCFNLLSGQVQFLVVFCFLINASYPRPFVPLSSVTEALLALSFPFLSEVSFSSALKLL